MNEKTSKILLSKLRRRIVKFCVQPIRVFCFHQVSETFEPEFMWECDWISTDDFKKMIKNLQMEYTFISLHDGYVKMRQDTFRMKKYAVLTADDGWLSVINIIPWLAENNIPITLFINPLYLDGIHKQERETEKLLTENDLRELLANYTNVSICSHGWTHADATKIDQDEFENAMQKAETALSAYTRKEPFYAFTYGHYKVEYLQILRNEQLIPVLMDGQKNYRYDGVIHREELK